MTRALSLANKCQLLFGAAIVVLLAAALATPWIRLRFVIDESLLDTSRQIALLWPGVLETESSLEAFLDDDKPSGDARPAQPERPTGNATSAQPPTSATPASATSPAPDDRVRIAVAQASALEALTTMHGFAAAAAGAILQDPSRNEYSNALWVGAARVHHYARVVRDDSGAIAALVFVEHRSPRAASLLFVNRVYILAAGMLAGALAMFVFYLILKRIIFSPVRALRDTAIRIAQGEASARADIQTADEFEDLAEAFNAMLASLEDSQGRLRELNQSLDLRLTAVSQANVALHESARVKSEFLANISHELRTPLNSIIGFADLLLEVAEGDSEGEGARFPARRQKRVRYLENIVVAGRSLLEMINDLLEMAKLEAGKTQVRIEPCNIVDTCEGLLALIRPQAERKRIQLKLEAPRQARSFSHEFESVTIETDARKMQQIIFNFLSNAVKFTGDKGAVTLRVERVLGGDAEERVRVSVLDTGPGIPPEQRARIFDKFTQLESGHTRGHPGTGLGLAIAKQLAVLIGADIQVESELGKGAMFSVIAPVRMRVVADTDSANAQARETGRHATHVDDAAELPQPGPRSAAADDAAVAD